MQHFLNRIREKALDHKQPPVLIVAFGDSVTQGFMENTRLDSGGVYHRQLQEKLESFFPITTFSTLNAGVGGAGTADALTRLERDVIRHQPDLVLIAFGLNDVGGGPDGMPRFDAALKEIIAQIRARTEADVILLTPPFMATKRTLRIHPDHESFADDLIRLQTSGWLAQYAQVVRDVARQTNTPLADIHREWQRLQDSGVDMDTWIANGLNHPTKAGHTLAAELVFAEILRHYLQGQCA